MSRFEFAWADGYTAPSAVFGIRPEKAWVEIDESDLLARFGPWSLSTPLSNITAVEVTGPYRWFKTAGPARLGVTDRGLTFATNGERGVLLTFAEPVRGGGPYALLRHPELTVTVADVDGLVEELVDLAR